MVRKLKHHEERLLKKVDFITWAQDGDHRDKAVARRYGMNKPEDYHKYNKLVFAIQKLSHRLSHLPPTSPVRLKHESLLLNKLTTLGLIPPTTHLSAAANAVTVSSFARRRLPVVMTRLRMAEHVSAATKMIEQGHVRVGTETVTDPAYLVTRSMEDFVTWAVGSKVKRNIMKYRDELDDFELL